ncbi:hypothetical protein QGM71_16760 [Virgibacillus sp. C22-A2]|uniref:Sporulation lipoprotein YhcN/YlaJ (Spore_YhcN_YlaJ) n=1 Tax=Virgibacillus tibetensis TaxID=3042313 RepID=A0ABU6KJV6_9BACI|nr:hypothetical protein [Virgibacillus sp. C22-A2]
MVNASLLYPHNGEMGENMPGTKIVITIALLYLLSGCGPDTTSDSTGVENQDIEFTTISTNSSIDQSVSNKAKESLSSNDALTSVNAVNTDKDLLIAVEVHHNQRFRLAKLRKELTKQMEKEFPKKKVELSTDQKIVLELEQLEYEIQSEAMSKKKLEKKTKRIIKLSKEQT